MAALELVRFALYVDLGIAFGVPAAALLILAQDQLAKLRHLLTALVLIGLSLTVLGYLLTVSEMAGTALRDFDWQLAVDLATGTSLGWAFLARIAALFAASAWCLTGRSQMKWLVIPTCTALASLAWGGHAAAGEGIPGALRLAGDIVHLGAASIWLGALVLFVAMLVGKKTSDDAITRALARFATIGSLVVAVLVATGTANLWFIAPPKAWVELLSHSYGALLAGKLGLFLAMLGLAAMNRFVLVPRLLEVEATELGPARVHLQIAIGLEFALALAILAIVAHVGLLDPSVG